VLLIAESRPPADVLEGLLRGLDSAGATGVEVLVGGSWVLAAHRVNPINQAQVRAALEPGTNGTTGGRIVEPTTSFLTSADFTSTPTQVAIGQAVFGGRRIPVVAGPCAVETRDTMASIAAAVAGAGATGLRGGAFKPQTLVYNFQGLGRSGLEVLAEVGREAGLFTVTEVMSPEVAGDIERYVDALQVGSRNMQNFDLLKRVGRSSRPVILKRGYFATVEEFLRAGEYVVTHGNPNVILCERGIRTFESQASKFILDLNAIAFLKRRTHLPVVADPSHGSGRRELVTALARAAVAAGADGLMIEVHPEPDASWTGDRAQTIDVQEFGRLVEQVDAVARAVGREVLVR